MAEREEQAHRVVRERREAEPLVETFRVVVRGVHDQGVHGDGFADGRDALDRIGEKHASESESVRRPVNRQPAYQGTGHRMARQFPGKLLGQRGQIDRQGAQRVEAEHDIGVPSGADERAGDPAPDILADLPRQVAVQFGKAAGEGSPVMLSSERLDDQRIGIGQREPTRRACSSSAARSRSFGGGGSARASKKRIASWRASAMVSCLSMVLSAVSRALDTMKPLTVVPSTDAACSIRRFAASLSRRLMRSLRAVFTGAMMSSSFRDPSVRRFGAHCKVA